MLKLIDSSDGFTIIEVLIVLAIAALILLIIFLSVPVLQRTSRNHEHRAAAVYIFQAYSDWLTQYGISSYGESGPNWIVDCSMAPDGNTTFCKTLKSSFGLNETNIWAYGSTSQPAQPPLAPVNNQLILSDFAKCNDDSSAAITSPKPQDIVILYNLETANGGSTEHCLGTSESNPNISL